MFNEAAKKFYYWHFAVSLIVIRYALFCIVNYIQYLFISEQSVPEPLSPYMKQFFWESRQEEAFDSLKFVFWENFLYSSSILILIGFGLLPKLWEKFNVFVDTQNSPLFKPDNFFRKSLLFYAFWKFSKIMILGPLLYSWRLDIIDHYGSAKLFSHFLNTLYSLLFLLLFSMVQNQKLRGLIVVIIKCIVVSVGHSLVYPIISVLSANKQLLSKLPEKKIMSLLTRTGFPLDRFVVDEDSSSTIIAGMGSWAVLEFGIGYLQLNLTDDSILAIVSHTIGHWIYSHSTILLFNQIVTNALELSLLFYIIDRKPFLLSFGFKETTIKGAFGLSLILFELLSSIIYEIFRPAKNYMKWTFAFRADRYCAEMGFGYGMLDYLVKTAYYSPKLMACHIWGLFVFESPVFSARMSALEEFIKRRQ